MRPAAALLLSLALPLVLVAGCAGEPSGSASPGTSTSAAPRTDQPEGASSTPPTPRKPLQDRVIVLDPGHQLGNRNFPGEIARRVPAGGMRKPCNTVGTETEAGYAEATFTWQVATLVRHRLERLGARVVLTRTTNSEDRWGPCVDVRGRKGNRSGADLKLSIHADGSYAAGARGFHVIRPPDRTPWTDDIAAPSKRFALRTRAALRQAGFPYATYIAGGDGLDVRRDLGTLNLSDIPTVMVELGNMRSDADAQVMSRASGRARYARALVAGIVATLKP